MQRRPSAHASNALHRWDCAPAPHPSANRASARKARSTAETTPPVRETFRPHPGRNVDESRQARRTRHLRREPRPPRSSSTARGEAVRRVSAPGGPASRCVGGGRRGRGGRRRSPAGGDLSLARSTDAPSRDARGPWRPANAPAHARPHGAVACSPFGSTHRGAVHMVRSAHLHRRRASICRRRASWRAATLHRTSRARFTSPSSPRPRSPPAPARPCPPSSPTPRP